jgi:hypothetical protein
MKKTASVIVLILGILFSLLGLAALAGGVVTSAVGSAQGDGYLSSGTARLSVGSHALTTPRLDAVGEGVPPRLPFDVGTLRLRASSVEAGKEIFVGIASQADVGRYLTGVHHSELLEVDSRPFRAEYRDIPGSTAPSPPGEQTFWTASASGAGEQELTWDLAAGSWAIVIMNADASLGVDSQVQAGFRSDLIRPAASALLVGGAVSLLIGLPLLILGAVGLGRHAGPPPSRQPDGPLAENTAGATALPGTQGVLPPAQQRPGEPVDRTPYPARLIGELDPALSRWMWLVKWFLAIPHIFVLIFLWFALLVTTVFAGFAILFTGRYPRPLFNFNVGVLRWNWRVAFYAYAAAGTDRYPPFTLARTDYPADFDVDYPDRLSRGLVLVKWWLLAIPHLLVVAALAGSTWSRQDYGDVGTTYERGTGLSLLGLLVLIAVVALLFTGRYLRPLFDLVIGINRWIYRVLAYTSLMRDEYPPFRLDQGPGEAPLHAVSPSPDGAPFPRPDAAAGQ